MKLSTRFRNAIVRSTSVRVAVGAELSTLGTLYASNPSVNLWPFVVKSVLIVAGVVVSKAFDEAIQNDSKAVVTK